MVKVFSETDLIAVTGKERRLSPHKQNSEVHRMVKKIGCAGTVIGGLLAMIGGIVAFVNSAKVDVSGVIGMAIMARIGAIILFISAIAIIADAFMNGSPVVGAIVRMVFGTAAFVGQFLINPYTSLKAMLNSALTNGAKATGVTAAIGFIIIIISGLVLLIMGVVGLASKKNKFPR